jgi:hypothetical protein
MPNSSATCDGLKLACVMKKLSFREQYCIWETIDVSRMAFQGFLAANKPVKKKQKYIFGRHLSQPMGWDKCQIGQIIWPNAKLASLTVTSF